MNGQCGLLPYKRLTEVELQDPRDKGICYRCDEKFFVGHWCKNKQLHVLLVEEDDVEKGTETREWEQDQLVLSDGAELSLNLVVGFSTPKSMKLRGRVMDQEVVVLINCGASHNFIKVDLVTRLGIPFVYSHNFGVLMGMRLSVQGAGLCKGVVLQLQDVEVKVDFRPLNLGSAYIILRMQWLETLGGMQVN